MVRIRVPLERLRSVASTLDSGSQEVDSQLQRMISLVDGLQVDWEGLAKIDYAEDFSSAVPPMRTRLAEMLERLAQDLRRIATEFEEADRAAVTGAAVGGVAAVLGPKGKDGTPPPAPPKLPEEKSPYDDLLKEYDGSKVAEGTDKRPWLPVDAPVKNAPGERDPKAYEAVLNQFAVGKNGRYVKNQQGKGETYCNIFTWDATRAMGAEIPHWVDANGNPAPVGQGKELGANASIKWLQTHGAERGWRTMSAEEAQAMANQGQPVVAAYSNPGGIGHVAMVRPGEYSPQTGPAIAQAGRRNFNSGSVKDGFGDRQVVYYVHA